MTTLANIETNKASELLRGKAKGNMGTNLLIAELRGTGIEREHQFEEYLAQGVILLRTFLNNDRLVRVFQVEKMRGLAIDNQPKPYEISAKGIEVYPSATIYK